ncbi:PhnA-like protein [Methylorubrum zatmanii]|uniref:PhnA-like protein n=1 Tax=Methylorubrum zatmanii TaxID=29429 RepID=A0ABW1WSN5_9HYPH|nr:PhnA-like protein [Methylorubrum zatmanii]
MAHPPGFTTSAVIADDTRTVARETVDLNQVSWGAVFAGAATALVTQVVINLVGVAAGLAAVDVNAPNNPTASNLSISAGVWFVGSGIVASLVGGLIAGRLAGKPLRAVAGLHGFVSWVVTTLVVLYLLTSAASGIVGGAVSTVGSALGGAGNLVGGAVQTAAQAAAPSLSKISNPIDRVEQRVKEQAAGQDPQAARDAAVSAVRALLSGDAADKQQAETRAADALAKAQNIPVDQARQQVQDYQKQYEQAVASAKKQAEDAAKTAKSVATQGSLYASIALILGAIAAFLGGLLSAPKPVFPTTRI